LKEDFFGITCMIDKLLRLHHVSYQGISDIMALIYPQGRDTIFNAFADSVEETIIPPPQKTSGLFSMTSSIRRRAGHRNSA
jgi:hypothetical protein